MIRRDIFFFRIFCITFWVFATVNFIFGQVLPPINLRPLYLALDLVILVLGVWTLRNKIDKILIGIFIVYVLFINFINKIPLLLTINGFRDYISLLFTLPLLRYFFTCKRAEIFRNSLNRQLKFFLILQAFCVTYQFIRYGAGDDGGGSLGYGASGYISILIISLSFYFVTKIWDSQNILKSLWNNRLYLFLIFPVFLNETKASFVFLLVYFILLFPFKIQSLGKLFIAIPFIFILFIGMYLLYEWSLNSRYDILNDNFLEQYTTGGDDSEFILQHTEDIVENLDKNFTEEDFESSLPDLPRFIKMSLVLPALKDAPGGYLFGAGIGHMKGGTTLERTDFYMSHIPFFIGTRSLMHIIVVPLGLLGIIWFFFWFKQILRFDLRKYPMALNIKFYILFVIGFSFIYTDDWRTLPMCFILYYISLTTWFKQEPKQLSEDNAE